MAVSDIIEQINADAEAEIKRLEAAARAARQEQRLKAEAAEAALIKELSQHLQAAKVQQTARLKSHAEQAGRAEVLAFKRERLNELYGQLLAAAVELPVTVWQKILSVVLKQQPMTGAVLVVPAGQAESYKKVLRLHANATWRVDEIDDLAAGFRIEGPEINVLVTPETLVDRARLQHEQNYATRLFALPQATNHK